MTEMDYILAGGAYVSGSTINFTNWGLGPGTILVVAVGLGTSTATASITPVAGGGTWVKVAANAGSSRTVELWVGYDFDGPADFDVVGSASNVCAAIHVIGTGSTLDSTPADTDSPGASGTSTSASTGSVTPAVGDLVICGIAYASTTAATSITMPSGARWASTHQRGSSSLSVTLATGQVLSTVSTSGAATIPSSAWTGVASAVTFPTAVATADADITDIGYPAAAGPDAHLYKGRATAGEDAGNLVP